MKWFAPHRFFPVSTWKGILVGSIFSFVTVGGIASPNWAFESMPDTGPVNLEVSLGNLIPLNRAIGIQQESLDIRIARTEALVQQMRDRLSLPSTPSIFPNPSLTLREEVPVLDEVLIQDTPLDAFEDPFADPFDDEMPQVDIPDPWESFNANMFSLNLSLDHYLLKPIATGYDWILPDQVEEALGRMFQNLRVTPHLLNTLFQGKFYQAGIVAERFLLNSTLGVAGLFDVAHHLFGLAPPPREDTGQTLALYGMQSGPYLVLPFLPPTTVRDGAGAIGDLLLDPLTYLLPILPGASLRATEVVHDRSQNLGFVQGAQQSTLDLYSGVREAYFQKQHLAILQ